jgi:DNA-binding GntR family transcriptional regulator
MKRTTNLSIVDNELAVSSAGREPLSTRAARLIRSGIMNGEYRLGEHLVETEIAARYDIRRHVVREALQVLEGEGLVVSDAFCGRSVFHPGPKEIEGLYLLRISLEAVAAALAAYKITPDRAENLRRIALVPADPVPDVASMLDWDVAIHKEIWSIADQPTLFKELERAIRPFMILTLEAFAARTDPSDVMTQVEVERDEQSSSGHAGVVAAICSQDSERARRAMVAHLSNSRYHSREMRRLLDIAFGK